MTTHLGPRVPNRPDRLQSQIDNQVDLQLRVEAVGWTREIHATAQAVAWVIVSARAAA